MISAPMLHDPFTKTVFFSISLVVIASWLLLIIAEPMQLDLICTSGSSELIMPAWSIERLVSLMTMWSFMPLAMMLPAATTKILQVSTQAERKHQNINAQAISVLQFAAGYSSIIFLISFAAAGAEWTLESTGSLTQDSKISNTALAGLLLLIAGIYQIIFKQNNSHRGYHSIKISHSENKLISNGFKYGYHTLGCCMTMITVQFVIGTMNLATMIILTLWMIAACTQPLKKNISLLTGSILLIIGSYYIFFYIIF